MRKPQPWPIRVTHWVSAPALFLMAMSGLQILVAYPFMGPQGAQWSWWPLQGWEPPAWMRVGDWLGGGRAWHFAVAWLFVGNGVVYAAYVVASGEWRRRLFWPPRDARNAVRQFAYYVRLVKNQPPADLYNGLQRLTYSGAIVLGLLQVLTGLAIWKPVQLESLALLFGGYDSARLIHFLAMALLFGFAVTHVVMVVLHPRTLETMINGGKPHE